MLTCTFQKIRSFRELLKLLFATHTHSSASHFRVAIHRWGITGLDILKIYINIYGSSGSWKKDSKLTTTTLPIGWNWFTCSSSLQSELSIPSQIHQLHYLASIERHFPITSYRKTSVLLQLSSFTFAEFFTLHRKI